MKKLNANGALSKREMKKIIGGGDEEEMHPMCNKCIEDAEADPYHPPYYSPPGCIMWHCPIEDPGPAIDVP